MLLVLGVAVTSLSLGCRSSGAGGELAQILPYHVAVAPPQASAFEDRTPHADEAGSDELSIDLGAFARSEVPGEHVDVAAVLGRELEASLFSKVTVLPEPPADANREAWFVDAARASGADLLMTIDEIVYDSHPVTKGKPWNWVWYSLGPFVYMFDDRAYKLDSTLEVALYDLNQVLESSGAELEDGAATAVPSSFSLESASAMRSFRAKPDWVATKFADRVEGGAFDYVKSLIVPTSLLRKEGVEVRRKVAQESVRSMAQDLARKIAVDAEFVSRPSGRAHRFFLDARGDELSTRAQRLDGEPGPVSHLVLETSLLQRVFSAERGFEVAEVEVGERTFDLLDGESELPGFRGSIELDDAGVAPEGWVRKRIRLALPIEAAFDGVDETGAVRIDRTFRLTLVDGIRAPQVRSWTFRVPAAECRIAATAIAAGMPSQPIEARAARPATFQRPR